METVWIILIIATVVVLIVWLLRGRLKEIFVKGNVLTGEVEMRGKAKPDSARPGVAVIGNKSKGDMIMRAEGGGTRIVNNTSEGNMDIQAKNKSK